MRIRGHAETFDLHLNVGPAFQYKFIFHGSFFFFFDETCHGSLHLKLKCFWC